MGRKHNRIKEAILYFFVPVLIYLVFIFGGFIFVFIESLGYIPAFGMTEPTFDHYIDILGDEKFFKSSFFSIYLAIISTTLSVIIGIYLASFMTFSNSKILNKMLFKLSNIIIILPYLFAILLVIWMFSDTGLLARILYLFGYKEDLGILYDDLGIGMILSFVLKGSAFVTVYVYKVMSEIKKDYFVLAKSMGVTKWKAIFSIYVPLCKNTIVWSSAILFAYTLGSFEVPTLLSNINQPTLATELFRLYRSSDFTDFPKAMASNICLLFINILCASLYSFCVSRVIKRGYE